jgi:ubiquinone/menaquinone biosynthesis C-methylase UbiE
VYEPIVRELVSLSPHPLGDRLVLDLGAGTGVAAGALATAGARSLAIDLSPHMLAWEAERRPPGMVADVRRLPLPDRAVDDVLAAFVFNHLEDPVTGLCEASRVTRDGGALLACVYANASRSAVRDTLDDAASDEGWAVPGWYTSLKEGAVPLLGTAEDMADAARTAGLTEVRTEERTVDVGVTEPEELVAYRLGQAHFAAWLADMEPDRESALRARLAERIRPLMEPYRPTVVFLSAVVAGG